MASYKVLAIFGLLLVTIVIRSAPVEKGEETVQLTSSNKTQIVSQALADPIPTDKTSSPATTTVSSTAEKKKRFIDNEQFDGVLDSDEGEDRSDKTNAVVHTKIEETSAQIHNNADKPVDTDDSKVFSDIKMTPNELTDILRRRREVKFNDQTSQRRKRALSPYDFYDTDSFYDPYADFHEQEQYDRPIRSFAPIYWYPSAYERTIRSALAPSYYESAEWPRLYSDTIDGDEFETPVYNDDDDEDEEESYESNRYPIIAPSVNDPFDNFELQQQYNSDDLPIDEDLTDEEEEYPSHYPEERSRYSWIF